MSILFSPIRIGQVELTNRFVHSATYEGMAEESGRVTEALLRRYRTLARGGLGLIIPGYLFVHRLGRAYRYQTGICEDEQVAGLRRLVEVIHEQGCKVALQLAHAGRQTTRRLVGTTPLGPSAAGRDPVNLVKPRVMRAQEIDEVIAAFARAAARAAAAGADGVQLHAAHGYLLNQFLSPFFNRRNDAWGGSDENRFRLLRQVYLAVREQVGKDMMVLIKLNTHDHTPRPGLTPALAARYAGWLAELGIDGIEISSGTTHYSFMNMCRGEVPLPELLQGLPWWKRLPARVTIGRLMGRYQFTEPYHLGAARLIRPQIGKVPLAVVGGMRQLAGMERLVAEDRCDLISLCRPLLREPFLVRSFQEGVTDRAACESCNRCLAAAANELPVRCYVKGLPAAEPQTPGEEG